MSQVIEALDALYRHVQELSYHDLFDFEVTERTDCYQLRFRGYKGIQTKPSRVGIRIKKNQPHDVTQLHNQMVEYFTERGVKTYV